MNWNDELHFINSKFQSGYTYRQIADILSQKYNRYISKDAVRSALRRYRSKSDNDVYFESLFNETSLPEIGSFLPELVRVNVDSIAVISDVHVPFHSKQMFFHLVNVLKHFDVAKLVIAGDLMNQDEISDYPANEPRVSLDEEVRKTGLLLEWLDYHLSAISSDSEIIITNGNHDERMSKRLNVHFSLVNTIQATLQKPLQSNLVVTDYDYIVANVSETPWIIGHASSFNKRPGEIAKRLAEKYRSNVAVGHDHIQGYSSTQDGEFIGISIGSMIDVNAEKRTNLWYKERRLSLFDHVRQGFLVIKDGVPFLFNTKGSSSLNGGMSWDIWYDKFKKQS